MSTSMPLVTHKSELIGTTHRLARLPNNNKLNSISDAKKVIFLLACKGELHL